MKRGGGERWRLGLRFRLSRDLHLNSARNRIREIVRAGRGRVRRTSAEARGPDSAALEDRLRTLAAPAVCPLERLRDRSCCRSTGCRCKMAVEETLKARAAAQSSETARSLRHTVDSAGGSTADKVTVLERGACPAAPAGSPPASCVDTSSSR